MKVTFLLICLLLASLLSCKKDKEVLVTGTVINPGGCYTDSWLVAIDNPDFSKQPFLRPAVISACITCYNCSNAVFIRLSPPLAAPGTRIKFSYAGTELSCLSVAEAPEHISVKNLSRL